MRILITQNQFGPQRKIKDVWITAASAVASVIVTEAAKGEPDEIINIAVY